MFKKSKSKTFRLNTIIDGQIISGSVAFSPAPDPGIFTELARFEAQRILEQMLTEEIAAGRLGHPALSMAYCVNIGYDDTLVLATRSHWCGRSDALVLTKGNLGAKEMRTWCGRSDRLVLRKGAQYQNHQYIKAIRNIFGSGIHFKYSSKYFRHMTAAGERTETVECVFSNKPLNLHAVNSTEQNQTPTPASSSVERKSGKASKPEKIRAELNIEKWAAIWQPASSKSHPAARVLERETQLSDGQKIVCVR